MNVSFDTTLYTNVHSQSPRGRGSWMFQVTEINGWEGEAPVYSVSGVHTFSAAKRLASQAAIDFAVKEFGHADNVRSILVAVLP